MNAAQSIDQNSVTQYVLLGTAASTLRRAMDALKVQAFLFSRIEPLADGEVAALSQVGCRAATEAVAASNAHADECDAIGLLDCLARVVSGHRTAKNLLLAIIELADADVAKKAQLGVSLATSVLDDLGA